MEHIKINIPKNEIDYIEGNGEGVWVLLDEKAKKAYDTDENGTIYWCVLDNDSWNYPRLVVGVSIPIEMRGENRPVVPYKFLQLL